MNDMFDIIYESNLYEDEALREIVLENIIPKLLVDLYGTKKLVSNLNEF